MEVSLTRRQRDACRYWGSERHCDYIGRAKSHRSRYKVAMPFAGWKALQATMAAQAFDRWGRWLGEQRHTTAGAGTRSALQKVSKAIAVAETHPALRGEAVIGVSHDMFAVWSVGQRRWSLTPKTGEAMQILIPQFVDNVIASTEINAVRFPEGVTTWTAVPADRLDIDMPFAEGEHHGWT